MLYSKPIPAGLDNLHDLLHAVAGGCDHCDGVRSSVGDSGTSGSRRKFVRTSHTSIKLCFLVEHKQRLHSLVHMLAFIRSCSRTPPLIQHTYVATRVLSTSQLFFCSLKWHCDYLLIPQFIGYILMLMSCASAFFSYRTWNRTKKGPRPVIV